MCVNALSGCYLISTRSHLRRILREMKCQCPLGLLPHFYYENVKEMKDNVYGVNALSGCYLISTTKTP